MTDYTDYSTTPADNTSPPPVGAPEGMYPSAVNDTMREMMSVVRQLGDQTSTTFGTFGSMALQASNNVHITGGTISGPVFISTTGTIVTSGTLLGSTFAATHGYINTLEVDLLTFSTGGTVAVSILAANHGYINTLEVDLLTYSGAANFGGSNITNVGNFTASGTISTGGTILFGAGAATGGLTAASLSAAVVNCTDLFVHTIHNTFRSADPVADLKAMLADDTIDVGKALQLLMQIAVDRG